MLLQEQEKKSRKTYTQKIWCAENRLNAVIFYLRNYCVGIENLT